MSDALVITAVLDADHSQFVRFTWNDDLTECDFLACGHIADDSLETLLDAKVHEGCDLEGWTVNIA